MLIKLIEKVKNNASTYERRYEYCERENSMNDLNIIYLIIIQWRKRERREKGIFVNFFFKIVK